jgi:hypothetical protein
MLVVVELSSDSSVRLVFDDVYRCVDIESFNRFVSRFLDERGLVGEARRRMYWALFYRWKKVLSSDS